MELVLLESARELWYRVMLPNSGPIHERRQVSNQLSIYGTGKLTSRLTHAADGQTHEPYSILIFKVYHWQFSTNTHLMMNPVPILTHSCSTRETSVLNDRVANRNAGHSLRDDPGHSDVLRRSSTEKLCRLADED